MQHSLSHPNPTEQFHKKYFVDCFLKPSRGIISLDEYSLSLGLNPREANILRSFQRKTKTAVPCRTFFPLGLSCFRDFLLCGNDLTRNILWTALRAKKRKKRCISQEITPYLEISVFFGCEKKFQEFLFKIKNGEAFDLVFF